jgi:hypothetical protein
MKTTIEQMENHIVELLNKFHLRTDLQNELFINTDTFRFRDDVPDEDRIWFYKHICSELKVKLIDRINIRKLISSDELTNTV